MADAYDRHEFVAQLEKVGALYYFSCLLQRETINPSHRVVQNLYCARCVPTASKILWGRSTFLPKFDIGVFSFAPRN